MVTNGIIFGENIWVPDSDKGPAAAATATIGRLDWVVDPATTTGLDIFVADESTHKGNTAYPTYTADTDIDMTAGPPVIGSLDMWAEQFNILGKLDTNWGTVVSREKGYFLWNTFAFDYATAAAHSLTFENNAGEDLSGVKGSNAGAAPYIPATITLEGALVDWQKSQCYNDAYDNATPTPCLDYPAAG